MVLPPLDHAERQRLILGGVLPGLGAAFMAFVIIYSLATDSLNGVEIAFGFGFALLGLILSVISQRAGKSGFYSRAGQDPARVGLRPPPE